MASVSVPHLLILEPDARGHAREWCRHLITGAHAAGDDALRLTLALPPALIAGIERELPAEPGHLNVKMTALSASETALCMHRRLWISGMARWWTMRRHLARTKATHGLFLGLDHLSLPLALGLGAGTRPLSGILFRPSVHYRALNPHTPTLRERIRDRRKAILYRLMLRNPALCAVLSLDPYFVDFAAHRYPHADKIVTLPDPTCPIPEPTGADCALAIEVPDDRKLFLLFGELTERKGVVKLLDALGRLSGDAVARTAVVIAGSVEPSIRDLVHGAVAGLDRRQPRLWLHLEDRRLTMGEIAALLRRSQVVLAPYQRFVGSSGILLWAAQARRPVLCQDYGLLGRMVKQFGLGLTVDTTDADALAEAIGTIAHDTSAVTIDIGAMALLCRARTPSRFARIVLSQGLCGHYDTNLVPSAGWSEKSAIE